MKFLNYLALILLIIGGVDAGIFGFFGFNPIQSIFGYLAKIFYMLFGLSGLYIIFRWKHCIKK